MAARQRLNISRCKISRMAQAIAMLMTSATMVFATPPAGQSRDQVIKIVAEIQRADYEGDRTALKRLHAELVPFVEIRDLAVRAQYWQGFAMWRRAINGFNDKVAAEELQADLTMALNEFDQAAAKDPAFVDAKIAALSCMGLLAFSVHQQEPDRVQMQEFIAQARKLRKEIEAVSPDNPRLLWVLGPMVWNTPAEHGGGQVKAIEMYEKGLETIRNNKTPPPDPLDPSWGEPELLMSLAWSNLNRTAPNLNAAQQEASFALGLVPYWHYVKDILMPQIQDARKRRN